MKVAAIIPAYNEEATIGKIIETVKQVRDISEIIVVNDGSSDHTSLIAKTHQVMVVDLPKNQGKSGAVMAGVRMTAAQSVLFLDADLVGLTPSHVQALLTPVLKEKKYMSLGIIDRGKLLTRLSLFFVKHHLPWPVLTGQRAVKRSVLDRLSHNDLQEYSIETALNEFCRDHNLPVAYVPLSGLNHVIKEKKMGFLKGFKARIKMFINVFMAFMKIRFKI